MTPDSPTLLPETAAYNAGEDLLERLAARGDAQVLICEGRGVSGAELSARVIGTQALLQGSGLTRGDRIVMLVRDTPAFFAGFIAAMRGGYIPVPISTLLPEKDVAFIAQDSGARMLLLDQALPLAQSMTEFPDELRVVAVRGWEIDGVPPATDSNLPAATTLASDPAFWLYTSGTTGAPKGVPHRHLDLPATADLFGKQVLGIGPNDRVFSAAKLFFAYGLGNALTFPIYLGAEVILYPERPTPEAVFELIQRESPTLFFGAPTLYAAMLAHSPLPSSLGPVRLCVSAGEALAGALYERFLAQFGVEIVDGLGSTEMLHIFLSNRPGQVRPNSSGKSVPGYQVRVVDEQGEDVALGEVGTLLAHGASAAQEYFNRPEETATTMFAPGWLRTGDSYRHNPDGTFTHEGRVDDMLRVSGQYVSPVEVEATLAEHPAVLESAVVGDLDEFGLVKPRAVVALAPGFEANDDLAKELQAFVKQRLAPHKYPRWVEFRADLPKTPTGKIKRYLLRK